MILSLLMGLLNMLFASKALQPIVELKNILVIGSTTGQFNSAEVGPLSDTMNKAGVFKWPLWCSGIGSLLALVLGLSLAGHAVW